MGVFERCRGCSFVKEVKGSFDFRFFGCFCPPFKGKWVSEIKDCPKDKKEE